jgi:hypothetical protein
MGDFSMSKAGSASGGKVRFNHGDEATGHDLALTFLDRSDAELAAIRDHYRGQGGGHVSFQLPAIIWQGHSTTSDVVPIEGRWKYAEPPEETHKSGGIHDVTVALQYVGVAVTS